jgi:hypothetical protein
VELYEILWKSQDVETPAAKPGGTTMNGNVVKPTPAQFDSYEEAAEFWDTHDTMDYLNEFRTAEVQSELRARHFEVEIAEDVVKALVDKASQEGVTVSHLASDLLRQQLQRAA